MILFNHLKYFSSWYIKFQANSHLFLELRKNNLPTENHEKSLSIAFNSILLIQNGNAVLLHQMPSHKRGRGTGRRQGHIRIVVRTRDPLHTHTYVHVHKAGRGFTKDYLPTPQTFHRSFQHDISVRPVVMRLFSYRYKATL